MARGWAPKEPLLKYKNLPLFIKMHRNKMGWTAAESAEKQGFSLGTLGNRMTTPGDIKLSELSVLIETHRIPPEEVALLLGLIQQTGNRRGFG